MRSAHARVRQVDGAGGRGGGRTEEASDGVGMQAGEEDVAELDETHAMLRAESLRGGWQCSKRRGCSWGGGMKALKIEDRGWRREFVIGAATSTSPSQFGKFVDTNLEAISHVENIPAVLSHDEHRRARVARLCAKDLHIGLQGSSPGCRGSSCDGPSIPGCGSSRVSVTPLSLPTTLFLGTIPSSTTFPFIPLSGHCD